MANLQKFGSHIKDQTLEQVQSEFCKARNWNPCRVQPTPKFKEEEYPRTVSWDEVKPLKWSWKAFQNYNRDVPRLKRLWEEKKANNDKLVLAIDNDNREFLALTPKKYSQFSKMVESFSSMSTVETFWLLLRLVFGFFISIMLVSLFENLERVWKPIQIETRKVDSVEVEAIQKMALLKTDRHWRFRDPKNIMKNFPTFPMMEGLKIISDVRNATLPQKPAKTRKVNVAGVCGNSAGETPTRASNVVIFRKKQAYPLP